MTKVFNIQNKYYKVYSKIYNNLRTNKVLKNLKDNQIKII